MEENEGKEDLLRDSDQVIHSVILKGAAINQAVEGTRVEPFARLCKCNIASGPSEGLPGCRLRETEEERPWSSS